MQPKISITGSLIVLLVVLGSKLVFHYSQKTLPPQLDVELQVDHLPLTVENWRGQKLENLGPRERRVLKLDQSLRRVYVNQRSQAIFLYIGYWQKQSGDFQAAKHSPRICLPANGWKILQEQIIEISLPLEKGSGSLQIASILAEINHKKALFYYWFFFGKNFYTEDWKALLSQNIGAFWKGRSDGGIVEVSIDLPEAESKETSIFKADETLKDFLEVFFPTFQKLIENK